MLVGGVHNDAQYHIRVSTGNSGCFLDLGLHILKLRRVFLITSERGEWKLSDKLFCDFPLPFRRQHQESVEAQKLVQRNEGCC